MCVNMCEGQKLMSDVFVNQSFQWTWRLLTWLDCLASKPLGTQWMHVCHMPAPMPHLSKKTWSRLKKLIEFPKRKNLNHESDSLAMEIKGNVLLNWISSGDLPRASEENFLTLKELPVHLSPTYTDWLQTSTGPASICLWAMGKRFASKTHLSHSALLHLLLTGDPDMIFISRLVIYNRFKWLIHFRVCKQTGQWAGSESSIARPPEARARLTSFSSLSK